MDKTAKMDWSTEIIYLQFKEALSSNGVSVTGKRLIDGTFGVGICPHAFQVAQDWLEVFPVVSLRIVLVLPCFEPLPHFSYLSIRCGFI